MELRLKKRFMENGLYKMVRRAFHKPVTIESSVIALEGAATDVVSHPPLEPYRYESSEAYRKNMLEFERKRAQALAEVNRQAFRCR